MIVYNCPENASTSVVQGRVSGLKVEELEVTIWIAAIEELLHNQERNQVQNQIEIATWESIGVEYTDLLNTLWRSTDPS